MLSYGRGGGVGRGLGVTCPLGVGLGLGVEDGVPLEVGVAEGVAVGVEDGVPDGVGVGDGLEPGAIRNSSGVSARWVSRISSIRPVNCWPTLPEMVHIRSGSGSFGWPSKVLNVFTPSI